MKKRGCPIGKAGYFPEFIDKNGDELPPFSTVCSGRHGQRDD
jgi:hypothetical protein